VIAVALRGLAGRKLRAALTAIAIVLGVAMISGTYVLTDTIDKAFNTIFEDQYANTDAVISGKDSGISFQGDQAATPPIPASILAKVQKNPNVAGATGVVFDDKDADIVKADGKALNTNGAPVLAFGLDPKATVFNPITLVEGTWPSASNEVVLDASTADENGYKLGDTVSISTLQPADRKSTRLNSSHTSKSRMPSSA